MARKKKLPVPSKGKDLQPHEKIMIAQEVCKLYAGGSYTIASCLARYGIRSESTWSKWCKEIEEIAELYKETQEEVAFNDKIKRAELHSRIVNKSLKSMEKMVQGYVVKVTEKEITPAGVNEDGKQLPEIVHKTKIKEVHVKPDRMLIMYALNNLDGNYFTRNPEPYQAGNEDIPERIEIEIIGGQVPPVTSEEDINENIG